VRLYAIAAAVTGVLAAAGCSSSTAPNGPAGGHSDQIEAVGSALGCTTGSYGSGSTCTFFFNPTPDTVAVGAAVVFKFDDVAHTVTWDAAGGLPNLGFTNGQPTGVMNSVVTDGTVTTPGTYTWHCSIHPYMHGTLVVTQ
jgi:plastocyanin